MANIDRLEPGQVLWTVSQGYAGNTRMEETRVHRVLVISVDKERREVTASWNGNPARTYRDRSVIQWRVNEPVLIRSKIGTARLATRAEIAEIKAKQGGAAP